MGGCFLSALGTLWWASVTFWSSPGNEAPSFIEKLLQLYCSSGSCVLFAPLAPLWGRRQACALVLVPRHYHSGFSLRARAGKKQEPEQIFPAMVASAVSQAAGTEVAVLREVASSVHGQHSQQSDSALAASSQAGLDSFCCLLFAIAPCSIAFKSEAFLRFGKLPHILLITTFLLNQFLLLATRFSLCQCHKLLFCKIWRNQKCTKIIFAVYLPSQFGQ